MLRPAGLAPAGEAYRRFESARWPNGARCPHCGGARVSFLQPRSGSARRTRTGRPTPRRVWKCAGCRRQFSVLTGTIWHGTRLDVATWLAITAHCESRCAVPVDAQLRRDFGLSVEAARHVRRLLSAALAVAQPDGGGLTASSTSLLARILQMDADEAARVRHAAARRPRPLRQSGPRADYGIG